MCEVPLVYYSTTLKLTEISVYLLKSRNAELYYVPVRQLRMGAFEVRNNIALTAAVWIVSLKTTTQWKHCMSHMLYIAFSWNGRMHG